MVQYSLSKKRDVVTAGSAAFYLMAPLVSRAQEASAGDPERSMLCLAAATTVAGLVGICGAVYGANKALSRKMQSWPKRPKRMR